MTFGQAEAVGIVWYNRKDYKRVLEVMEGAHVLPSNFDKWINIAHKAEEQVIRSKKRPVRAVIQPDEFVAWCASNNLKVDAQARNRFANEAAYRAIVGDH